ncbi:MAG TPA: hypothetical protein VH458_02695 [Vicinamibacterales bacterium]|jgi:hypothetical protein
MSTFEPDARPPAAGSTQSLKRRGLLAAGAAFVAGLVARLTEQPVSAGVDGDVVLGTTNTAAATTKINCSPGGPGLWVDCTNGAGVLGVGAQYGVQGETKETQIESAGVAGFGGLNSPGVYGWSPSAPGVFGTSNGGSGVVAQTLNNYSILGMIPASSPQNTIAIYAQNYSTYAGPSPGAGGFAIYGLCAKGHGLVGATATSGGAAVVGASNGVAGAYAGAFYGSVVVSGAFTVAGGPKSAAVPHPDGSHRRLYCLESPESWFEDFGIGMLECGRADVPIDPDFAALVDLSEYHVFLSVRGTQQVLSIVNQGPTGFTVEANRALATLMGKTDTDLNGAFSWRVVAKRKDIAVERLARVTVPPEPTLPAPAPDIPTLPGPRRRR